MSETQSIVCADAIDFFRAQPPDTIDLVIGSPPYSSKGERYGSGAKHWKTLDWVEWMVEVTHAASRKRRFRFSVHPLVFS